MAFSSPTGPQKKERPDPSAASSPGKKSSRAESTIALGDFDEKNHEAHERNDRPIEPCRSSSHTGKVLTGGTRTHHTQDNNANRPRGNSEARPGLVSGNLNRQNSAAPPIKLVAAQKQNGGGRGQNKTAAWGENDHGLCTERPSCVGETKPGPKGASRKGQRGKRSAATEQRRTRTLEKMATVVREHPFRRRSNQSTHSEIWPWGANRKSERRTPSKVSRGATMGEGNIRGWDPRAARMGESHRCPILTCGRAPRSYRGFLVSANAALIGSVSQASWGPRMDWGSPTTGKIGPPMPRRAAPPLKLVAALIESRRGISRIALRVMGKKA